ncbi:MAG: ATP-dependent Clp protease proteolytic subunit [Planctomycetes bacterium]|nr:ATP-dependent Clp protease proteolytic subunit [Planctomycetota bacterium]
MSGIAEPFKNVYVYEKLGGREYQFDIWSRLLLDRIVFINGEVTDGFANYIIAQLLFLQKENRNQDINVFINSPGGSVTAGLAIYDTLKYVQCDVATYCIGQAASMGAVLLASGTKGKRFSLPHSRIMIHQPWGGAGGTATDIGIQAREIGRLKETLNQILAESCGKELAQIEKDSDRDFFMSADEAREYGIVDDIVVSLKDVDKK